MILCITKDHEVYRYPDSLSSSDLRSFWYEGQAVLRVDGNGEVYEWIGPYEDVPAVGWTRIEHSQALNRRGELHV